MKSVAVIKYLFASLIYQKRKDMKTFKITYKRENGTIGTEIVSSKSEKLNKRINDYYFHINAEILSVELA